MAKNKRLKQLERDVVKHQEKSEGEFMEEGRMVSEDTRQTREGLGIEEEEHAGSEAYPEIEKALKDPDESDEEEEE